MSFTYTDSSQPTVVAPGPAPQHAVVVGPSTAAPTPKPVVSEQSTAPTAVIPAPRVQPPTADVATPPPASKGDSTVVVDVPIPDYPPLPEKPGQQDPEDPDPEPPKPPVLDDPNFKQPEPPEPPDLQPGKFQAPQPQDPQPPKPKLPTFVPDLPLTPKPPVVIDPVFGP